MSGHYALQALLPVLPIGEYTIQEIIEGGPTVWLVVVNVLSVLQCLNPRLEKAVASLGAGPARVLAEVTQPLALPGILSGAVVAFATPLGELVLTVFVAGPDQRTGARQMFSTTRENIRPAIAVAAADFILTTPVLGQVLTVLRKRQANGARPRRQNRRPKWSQTARTRPDPRKDRCMASQIS